MKLILSLTVIMVVITGAMIFIASLGTMATVVAVIVWSALLFALNKYAKRHEPRK